MYVGIVKKEKSAILSVQPHTLYMYMFVYIHVEHTIHTCIHCMYVELLPC